MNINKITPVRLPKGLAMLILILSVAGCGSARRSSAYTGPPIKNMDEYVEMKFTIDKDTVVFGDFVNIDIEWYNFSDSTVTFSPNVIFNPRVVDRDTSTFVFSDPSFIIYKTHIGSDNINIPPGEIYRYRLILQMRPCVFYEAPEKYQMFILMADEAAQRMHFISVNKCTVVVLRPVEGELAGRFKVAYYGGYYLP